jgi:hypothetical protein
MGVETPVSHRKGHLELQGDGGIEFPVPKSPEIEELDQRTDFEVTDPLSFQWAFLDHGLQLVTLVLP